MTRWINYLLFFIIGVVLATAFWSRINDRDWRWWQGRYDRCVDRFVDGR